MSFFKRIKSLFSSYPASQVADGGEAIEYEGFSIQPIPKSVNNGWSTEAMITMGEGDNKRTHYFIRADTSPTAQSAVVLIVMKAKAMIDQAGESIFK